MVYSFSLLSIFIFRFNFLHNFLHRYSPKPVECSLVRLLPVKPLSKTLGKSLSLIPQPLSFISNITLFFSSYPFSSIIFYCLSKYLMALLMIWLMIKIIHFSSVATKISKFWVFIFILFFKKKSLFCIIT